MSLYVTTIASTIFAHYKRINDKMSSQSALRTREAIVEELKKLSGGSDIATISAIDSVTKKYSYDINEINPNWHAEYLEEKRKI